MRLRTEGNNRTAPRGGAQPLSLRHAGPALAIENGAGLATFDRDFRKYKGLKLVEL